MDEPGRMTIQGDINTGGGDFIGRDQIIYGYTAEQVAALITEARREDQPLTYTGERKPYLGLISFQEADALLFFGREKLVEVLTGRVNESRFVCIAGPSGSGKSSVVQAGLLVALKAGCLPGSEKWLYAAFTPKSDPLAQLARAFDRLARSPLGGEFLRKYGPADPTALHRQAESLLDPDPNQRLVLFVDQFEELFDQGVQEPSRQAFIDLLTQAAAQPEGRVTVLLALRADFVAHCARYPQLRDLISRQFQLVGALAPEELARAIILPALKVGVQVAPNLAAQVIADMKAEPGALPLMQFALKDLFDARSPNPGDVVELTLEDYLARGGVYQALKRHADETLAKLDPPQQEIASDIFLQLIQVTPGQVETRRTVEFEQLATGGTGAELAQVVIDRLAEARLVTIDKQEQARTLTIAHEKLIDAWPWLNKLVKANLEIIAAQNRIDEDAGVWAERSQEKSYLYRGLQLMEVTAWAEKHRGRLSDTSRRFIEASQQARLEERRAVERRRNILIGSGTAIMVVITLLGIFGWSSSLSSGRHLATAQARGTEAAKLAAAAQESALAERTAAAAAQNQANVSLARQLAVQAADLLRDMDQSSLALLLGIESLRRYPELNANIAVGKAFSLNPVQVAKFAVGKGVNRVAFSPDGKQLFSRESQGFARAWDISTGQETFRVEDVPAPKTVYDTAVFSPNGKWVATGSKNQSVRVWEVSTGREVSHLSQGGDILSVAFSPDGTQVLSCADNGTVVVWQAQTGQENTRIPVSGGSNWASFSPDGKRVVTHGSDQTVYVWNASTGKQVLRIPIDQPVLYATFSPAGQWVVTGSMDNGNNNIQVWDADTGEAVSNRQYIGKVYALAFSPDGQWLVTGGEDMQATVWDISTGDEIAHAQYGAYVFTAAFSPDGQWVVSGGGSHNLSVWDIRTGKEIAHLNANFFISSVAFSPDGKRIVSSSQDGVMSVWKIGADKEIARMQHGESVSSVAFSPNGEWVVSGSADRSARVWEAATGREVGSAQHVSTVASVSFHPSGRRVVSAGSGSIQVWEPETGKQIWQKDSLHFFHSAVFSSDGKWVAAIGIPLETTEKSGFVWVWDAATGQQMAKMQFSDRVTALAFSPDGQWLVTGSQLAGAQVWESSSGKEVFRPPAKLTTSAGFSPDGKWLVTGGMVEGVQVWEISTGKLIGQLENVFTSGVLFSPDGKRVASVDLEGKITVWEVLTGKAVEMQHKGEVNQIAFSRDGTWLASSSQDGTDRVWETATGKEIARAQNIAASNDLAFSPDGRWIVSAGEDGSARVWIWQAQDVINEACKHADRNLTQPEWQQYLGSVPYRATCPGLPAGE